MARFPASGARQFSEEPQIWDHLKQAIAAVQFRWQLERLLVDDPFHKLSLDHQIRRYLRNLRNLGLPNKGEGLYGRITASSAPPSLL